MSGTMLYQPGKTFLHRADARAKIAAIIVVLVMALTTTRIDVLIALTAAVVLGLAVLARITPASYARALYLIVPLILLLTLLQALVQSGPAIATIGGISLSRAGVLLGLGIGMRLFAMGICFYGFSVTTSPSDIALALHKVGVPYKFAYLTSFAFRFLPLLQDEARTLLTAMAVRGSAESSSRHPLRRGRAIVRMLFPMLMRLDEAQQRDRPVDGAARLQPARSADVLPVGRVPGERRRPARRMWSSWPPHSSPCSGTCPRRSPRGHRHDRSGTGGDRPDRPL